MLDEITGLPAHPLIVHLPIVLGPVLGLFTLALLVPSWRERLLKITVGLAVVFAISTWLAGESGESFAATLAVGEAIEEHEEAAEMLRNIAFLLAIVLVGYAVLFKRLGAGVRTAGVVVIALLGVATIGFTIKTGHEGAKQVWQAEYDAAKQAQP